MRDLVDDLVEFWFGSAWVNGEQDDRTCSQAMSKLWWGHDPETDAVCRKRYGEHVERALAGEYDDWTSTPRSALALILLCDQLTRMIHRGTPAAFSGDAKAQRISLDGIATDFPAKLRGIERLFFYLPLEHAEDVALQEQSVALFRELADTAPAGHRELYAGLLDYARRHRDIVARFGRFPHRNATLGRESTAEEVEFLKQPNSSF